MGSAAWVASSKFWHSPIHSGDSRDMAVPHAYAAAIVHSRFAARTLPRLDAAGCLLDPSAAITADVLRCHREAHWPGLSQRPQEQAIAGLREFRNSTLLAIMARDLSGQADLAETSPQSACWLSKRSSSPTRSPSEDWRHGTARQETSRASPSTF